MTVIKSPDTNPPPTETNSKDAPNKTKEQKRQQLSRRDFLKIMGAGAGSFFAGPGMQLNFLDSSRSSVGEETRESQERFERQKLEWMTQELYYLQLSNPRRYGQDNIDRMTLGTIDEEELLSQLEAAVPDEELSTLSLLYDVNMVYRDRGSSTRFSFAATQSAQSKEVIAEIPPKQAILIMVIALEAMPESFHQDIQADLPYGDTDVYNIAFAERIEDKLPDESTFDVTTTLGFATGTDIVVRTNLGNFFWESGSNSYTAEISRIFVEEIAHLKMQERDSNPREQLNQILGVDFVVDSSNNFSESTSKDSRNILWKTFLDERGSPRYGDAQISTDEFFNSFDPNYKLMLLSDNTEPHPLLDKSGFHYELMYTLFNLTELHEGAMRNLALYGEDVLNEMSVQMVAGNFNRYLETFQGFKDRYSVSSSAELLDVCRQKIEDYHVNKILAPELSEADAILSFVQDEVWGRLLPLAMDGSSDDRSVEEQLGEIKDLVFNNLRNHMYRQWGFTQEEIDTASPGDFIGRRIIDEMNIEIDNDEWTPPDNPDQVILDIVSGRK